MPENVYVVVWNHYNDRGVGTVVCETFEKALEVFDQEYKENSYDYKILWCERDPEHKKLRYECDDGCCGFMLFVDEAPMFWKDTPVR